MICHLSIGAAEPERVATVLAKLWGGCALPFPFVPGSYLAFAYDQVSAIEVYPLGTELVPGEGDEGQTFRAGAAPPRHCPTHVALASPVSAEAIAAAAAEAGWRTLECRRGGAFRVIELWVEGRTLVELFSHDMLPEFFAQMNAPAWRARFGGGGGPGAPST